jgi:hypothetical protein
MFGGPEVSYHQTHSARDWLSILRTPYTTQNLQRERGTDGESNCNSGDGTGQMAQPWMFMMMMMMMMMTFWVCACNIAVVIGHAKWMRRIMLSSLVCLAVPYFPTLSHKRYDLRGGGWNFIGHKMYVLIFSTAFVYNFLQSKNSARYYLKCTQVFM